MYKQVDEQGNITYSDVATKKDEKPIAPPKVMTYPSPNSPSRAQTSQSDPPTPSDDITTTRYASIQIEQPANGQAIRANGGAFQVQLTSSPDLDSDAGHHYVILLDGKTHQSSTVPGVEIANVARGPHTLSAQIQNRDGHILANSSTITVHVLRASIRRP